MNVRVQKFLIAAIVALYLSCETCAVPTGDVEAEVDIDGAEQVDVGVEEVDVKADVGVGGEAIVDEGALEVGEETAATAVTLKCGDLVCPNGVFCEIKEIPSDDEKKITITTRCRDADGNVLDEKTTTEDVPEGEIPFTSFKKKVIKTDKNSGFFGSSYAGSFSTGNIGSVLGENVDEDAENLTEFDFDGEKGSIGTLFDDIMSTQRKILQSTSDIMHSLFGEKWW